MHTIGVPEEERIEGIGRKISVKIMVNNFLNLMKIIDLQIDRVLRYLLNYFHYFPTRNSILLNLSFSKH